MNDKIYALFEKAKKNNDINLMKWLYDNTDDVVIGFSYAKMLIKNKQYEEAKKILLSLLNTRNDSYARLELGKIEKINGDIEKAREYFEFLVNKKNDIYARIELGKLENENGNVVAARNHFESLLNSKNADSARLELGKLEKESGNIEEARKHFKNLLNAQNATYARLELGQLEFEVGNIELSKKHFVSLLTGKNRQAAINLLIIAYIKSNNFLEAIKLANMALKENVKLRKSIILYLSKRLNIYITDTTNYYYNYSDNQLLDYDEYLSIEHIAEHHKLDFSEDIDIYSLFNSVSEYLNDDTKINKLYLYDTYLIPYKKCGKEGQNYLIVITLPDSKQIIAMYPGNSINDIEKNIDVIELKKIKKYNK